ncbi:MAG: AAA family ATPase [Nannocystaceae bacterium]|nr:AAA family ATPase [Nannocystaceae bacterium]
MKRSSPPKIPSVSHRLRSSLDPGASNTGPVSASITGLHLHNYGCIKELRLEGLGRLHAFIGPNDSGKSTILRGIQTLCRGMARLDGSANDGVHNDRLLKDNAELRLIGDWVAGEGPNDIGSLARGSESAPSYVSWPERTSLKRLPNDARSLRQWLQRVRDLLDHCAA